MISAYADTDNDLLVLVFQYEIDAELTDADPSQYVMAALAPGATSPTTYESIELNQIALDFVWPVVVPETVTLVYTPGVGGIYRERGHSPIGGFSVVVVFDAPPEPKADRAGGARSRDKSRGTFGGPL